MTPCRDHHATIFVPIEAAGWIEAARRRWDPVMAARIAAHVTLIYPQEAPDVSLLTERLAATSAVVTAVRLRLGGIVRDEAGGVYLDVEDVDGGYRRLRDEILRPPFRPVAFTPHVTIVHPLTSERRCPFRDDGAAAADGLAFGVHEVAITGFDGEAWITVARYGLGGSAWTSGSSSTLGVRLPGRPMT